VCRGQIDHGGIQQERNKYRTLHADRLHATSPTPGTTRSAGVETSLHVVPALQSAEFPGPVVNGLRKIRFGYPAGSAFVTAAGQKRTERQLVTSGMPFVPDRGFSGNYMDPEVALLRPVRRWISSVSCLR
jgi:hypothetical protein